MAEKVTGLDPKDRKELLDLFDRGGQTLGYYTEHNGRDMVVCHEKPAFRQETGNFTSIWTKRMWKQR